MSMFQQQQSLLQTLLTQQQEMRDEIQSKHVEFDKQLATVEEQMRSGDQSTTSNSSFERKKIKVTRDLSVSFSHVFSMLVYAYEISDNV